MAEKKSKASKGITVKSTKSAKPILKTDKAVFLPVVKTESLPARQDPLQRYFSEVSRYPILSLEEEEKAARHYIEHQDTKSAQALVLSNLRLVVKISLEYRSAYSNLLDLIQEGNMGLMRAVQKFDPDRGVRFASYAAWWVRAYILKYILDNYRMVKIGTTQAQKKLFFNLIKEKERMEREGFIPTAKKLSERLDVKEREVQEMQMRMGSRDMELDAPKGNFEGAINMDFLASGADESAEDKAESDELKERLLSNLESFTSGLKEKEKKIFHDRLYTEIPKTLQEIADDYGITRERVRQIEERLVGKMRTFFKEKGLDVSVKAPDHVK
jgi:RNA polymerase sigma-32 factor